MSKANNCSERTLEPDLEQARLFLKALTIEDDPKVTFQTFDDNADRKDKVLNKILHGTLNQYAQELTRLNNRGAGIYVMVNQGDGKGRKAENVTRIRANFADLDGSPLEPVVADWEMKPQIIVESSSKRYHAYWLTYHEALTDFRQIQKEIAAKFKGDSKVIDLPRVLRLPGFWHQKGNPFQTRIMELNTNSHSPYSPDELIKGLGLNSSEKSQSTGGTSKPAAEPSSLNANKIHKGERNNTLTSEVGRWWGAGYSRKLCFFAAWQFSKDMFDPPLTDDEVKGVLKSVTGRYPQGTWTPKGQLQTLPETRTFLELQQAQIQPVKWIVPKLVLPGLTLIAAKPKTGKSWLALNMALDIAAGHPALGQFDCVSASSLYLALEDNDERLRERLDIILKGSPAPPNGRFTCEWHRLDQEPSGLTLIKAHLDKYPETRFVVIDTWQKVRPLKKGSMTDYERDYMDMQGLQRLAGERNVAIWLVHHAKKEKMEDVFDEILGSTAMLGCADSAWILERRRGEDLATLHATERSYKDDIKFSLAFDKENGCWRYNGLASEVQKSKERAEIRNAILAARKPLSIREISDRTGRKYGAVSRMLQKMLAEGSVEKAIRGKYRLPPEDALYEDVPF